MAKKKINIEGRKAENKPSNRSNYLSGQPFSINFELNLRSMIIIKQLLKGTESNEWLTLAEKNTYKKLKK